MRARMASTVIFAAALAVIAVIPSAVSAHGGPLVYSGEAGPYRVEVYRLFASTGDQQVLTYTLYLRTTGGRPVDGATVEITARRGEEVYGPTRAGAFTNQYEVQFPVSDAGGNWIIDVTIDSPIGPATLTHTLPSPSSLTATAAPYVLLLVIIAGAWAVMRWRRRARQRER